MISELVIATNAGRNTPPGSTVTCVIASAEQTVRIEVCDEGEGLAKEDRPYMFEAFQQGRNENTSAGSGLGLVIAKQAAETLKGSVEVDSRPGDGTRFIVALPIEF